MRVKKAPKVDERKLNEEFFAMVTEMASFRGTGEGPSFGYLYGYVSGFLQGLSWVPEVQAEMQRRIDEHKRENARLAVPAESI